MTSDSRTARRHVGVRLEEEIQAQKIALESRVKRLGFTLMRSPNLKLRGRPIATFTGGSASRMISEV